MKRIEIIANRSVQSEIISGIENAFPDMCYTLIENVHGKGSKEYRMGTATWPEVNFMLIIYTDDNRALMIGDIIDEIKQLFTDEGIQYFSI
jgi:hypothetical protein